MKREEIRKLLPSGSIKELAKRTGYTPIYVGMWFRYKNNNEKIENEAMKFLADYLETKKVLIERLKSVL